MIQVLLEQWDGMGVATRYDAATASWFFIALHDTRRGPAVGGTRLRVYDTPADGLRDAMRLAEGMTYKWAGIDIPYGGGKGVIALARPVPDADRVPLLQRYGRLVRSLRGAFMTGQDLGTTPEDMVTIARETEFVHGIDRRSWTALDPGPYTARGVFAGIRAAAREVLGSDGLMGCRVVIQGAGDVGRPLARHLRDEGATLFIADVDRDRAGQLADDVGAAVTGADDVYTTACEVYAPCAVGATVNADTIPRLACRIVAGSANNQLAAPDDAERLHDRGILYAPDYLINGGGATAFGLIAHGTTDEPTLTARCDGIGDVLAEVFEEAGERDESPVHAARRRVERVLAAAGG